MHRLITHNAAAIRLLHDTARDLDKGEIERRQARKEFVDRYDALAFPGGLGNGLIKLSEGDPTAVETALSFLEVRPYFFRSQYIATKIRRMLKQAALSRHTALRLQKLLAEEHERKMMRLR